MWDLRQAARAVDARLGQVREPCCATGATCDSRRVRPGDLFVALPGRRHDGHAFLKEAFARGAAGALVNRPVSEGHNLLLAENTQRALWDLAAWRRRQLQVPVVGVTGSFGKTTTKELLTAALSARYRTFRAPESYNTELGVPLAILSVPDDAEAVVLEMGMSARGEIRRLTELARPWGGIITGVGEAHLATVGTIEDVAEAKWELAEAVPEEGALALAWDYPHLRERIERCRAVVLRFGRNPQADFRPHDVVDQDPSGIRFRVETPPGVIEVSVPMLGEHVAVLASGALAMAWAMGVRPEPAARALADVQPIHHRLELRSAPFGWILDDSYNANPLSVRAAMHSLTSLHLPVERRAALLGDMLDLGPQEACYHRKMVEEANWQGLDRLYCFGERAAAAFAHWEGPGAAEAEELDSLVQHIAEDLAGSPSLLLVKGSRRMGLERAVDALSRA